MDASIFDPSLVPSPSRYQARLSHEDRPALRMMIVVCCCASRRATGINRSPDHASPRSETLVANAVQFWCVVFELKFCNLRQDVHEHRTAEENLYAMLSSVQVETGRWMEG